MKTFGERVSECRKKKGMTQKQLAELLHVSDSSISRWESNEGYPDISLLVPLADVLGVSVDQLLRENQDYRDIHKKDLETWLPFLVAVGAILTFYMMSKLGISIVLALFFYGYLMHFSKHLLNTYTDRTKSLQLHRLHTLFHFFVLNQTLSQFTMLLYLSKMLGMPLSSFFAQPSIDLETNFAMNGLGLFTPYLISFVVSIMLCALYYFHSDPRDKEN